MTETLEGVVREIRTWVNGSGADVLLQDSDQDLYYHGKMDIVPGQIYRFEVKEGEGERAKMFEILNAVVPSMNPELPKPQLPPQRPGMKSYVQIPYDQFMQVISSKSGLDEVKAKCLTAAVSIYAAMGKFEKDPKAAAHDVVMIAHVLEGYWV